MDNLKALIRPILTVGGFAAATMMTLFGGIPEEQYWTAVTMMLAFWFGGRNDRPGTP